MKKIGIIGAGNLGCAIAKGFISQSGMSTSHIYLSRRRSALIEEKQKDM
jgi:pyrroline-5-carboxylate reductase